MTAVLLAACTSHGGSARRVTAHPRPATPNVTTPRAATTPTQVQQGARLPGLHLPGTGRVAGAVAVSRRDDSDLAVVTRRRPAGTGQGPITVVAFNPVHTRLVLHAGSSEPTPTGLVWRHGAVIRPVERRALVAVLNGGFKLKDSRGGWQSEGRTIAPLRSGAASVVIYADGGTDIGAWGRDVPQAGRRVSSVRQNLELLIDRGRPQRTQPVSQPVLNHWWGHAFREQHLISRSALGVTAQGALVWAAGTRITVAALAGALREHGVVRALELDVNAPLVRGFLFVDATHVSVTAGSRRVTAALPLVTGQTQTVVRPPRAQHCTYVDACTRDYFTVLTR